MRLALALMPLLLVAGAARAAEPIDEGDARMYLERAAEHRHVNSEELKPETKEAALGPMQPSASCPTLTFDAVNINEQPLYALEVDIEQSIDDTNNHEDSFFIPYLPGRSRVVASVDCTANPYSYRNTTRTIGSAGLFVGFRLDAERKKTVMAMLITKANAQRIGNSWQPAKEGNQTLAGQALEVIDSDQDFKDFASALLELELGASELGKFVGEHPLRFEEALALARKAPAAQQAAFAAAAIGGSRLGEASEEAVGDLLKMQCSGSRAGAQTMWLAASKGEIGDETVRDAVLERCAPSKRELAGWMGRIEEPEDVAHALAGLPDELFADAFALALKRSDSLQACAALAVDAAQPDRRKAGRDFLLTLTGSTLANGRALDRLVQAKEASRTDEAAELVTQVLGKIDGIDPEDRADAVVAAFAVMLEGKAPLLQVRQALMAKKEWGGPALDDKVKEAVAGQAKAFSLFEPGALNAALGTKMSPLDYYLAVKLLTEGAEAPCRGVFGESSEGKGGLRDCFAAVSQQLAPLAGVAWKPGLLQTMQDEFLQLAAADETWAQVRKMGGDVSELVASRCREARYSSEDSFYAQQQLKEAATIDPDAKCVAEVHAYQAGAKSRRLVSLIIRSAILAALIALALWLVFRKVRKEASLLGPDPEARAQADGPLPGGLFARLSGPSLVQRVNAGLGDAQQTLARDQRPEAQQAARLIAQLPASAAKGVAGLAADAGESVVGAVRSRLVQTPTGLVYLVAFPGRAGEPRSLRRQKGFAQGWLEHMKRVRQSARQSGLAGPITAVVVFLGADASQGTLLVSFHDDGWSLVPLMLIDDRESTAGIATHAHRSHFNLEAGSPVAAQVA